MRIHKAMRSSAGSSSSVSKIVLKHTAQGSASGLLLSSRQLGFLICPSYIHHCSALTTEPSALIAATHGLGLPSPRTSQLAAAAAALIAAAGKLLLWVPPLCRPCCCGAERREQLLIDRCSRAAQRAWVFAVRGSPAVQETTRESAMLISKRPHH